MSQSNFFEFRERLIARRGPASAPQSAPAQASSSTPAFSGGTLSVSQLTAIIDRAMKVGVPSSVLVKGEVSNLNYHRGSGHLYFTMKDKAACVDCVMFKSDNA